MSVSLKDHENRDPTYARASGGGVQPRYSTFQLHQIGLGERIKCALLVMNILQESDLAVAPLVPHVGGYGIEVGVVGTSLMLFQPRSLNSCAAGLHSYPDIATNGLK